MRRSVLLRRMRSPVRVAYVLCVGFFLWCVAQFFHGRTGFSSLISIGDMLTPTKVTALRGVPHYIYEGSPGYDGAYYAQLALYPTLDNPELNMAIDNLPYRAKRILFCWAAWALGLGQPAWIVQAHALLNVLCWLGLAWTLLRWFPPDRWENFLRWALVMFSHGVIMSVRHSLVDGPSLLLVALALRWLEDGRSRAGTATLALAGLGKETSLLAAAGIDFDWRQPRTWGRTALTLAVIALPLALWMGYVRWKFGPAEDPGMGNFTWPFAGYIEKWGVAWHDSVAPDGSPITWATFAVVVALGAQWIFFAVRWRPAERWWRVGAAFALMMTFLSTPVWEGFPGAATRVLLPMTLAFNILVPRGARWLPLLLAGNLMAGASVFEFSPPHEFFQLRGERAVRAAVRIEPVSGWHGPERHLRHHWRWSTGNAEVRVTNAYGRPVTMTVHGTVMSANDTRAITLRAGEKLLWDARLGKGDTKALRFEVTLPPGETMLLFSTDRPAVKVDTDPRDLAFQIANLEIVVQPAAVSR